VYITPDLLCGVMVGAASSLRPLACSYLLSRVQKDRAEFLAGMMHYLYLAIAIVAEIFGTLCLKASDGFSKLMPSLGVVLGYSLAFFFLSLTLKVIPVGIAYALWSGVGIALISLLSWLLFRQSLDLPALIGIGLILAGVFVLNVFSKSGGH
jgi:small multidrug resistance pump